MRRALGVLMLTLVALAAACGERTAGPVAEMPASVQAPQAQGPLALSAPATLLAQVRPKPGRTVSTSFEEADVIKAGDGFNPLLPLNAVNDVGATAHFVPTWDGAAQPQLSDLAYCTYHFEIPGYDRNPQVRLSWIVPPDDNANVFIGLANWDRDRWDWFKPDAMDRVNAATMAPYLSFSYDIFVVVAYLGATGCQLGQVRIGGLPPSAALDVSRTYGRATPTFDFLLDAQNSTDPEGLPLSYEFDPEGDGSFLAAGSSELDAELTEPGTYHPAVRVTNSSGISATAEQTVYVVGDGFHTWGLSGNDELLAVDYGSDGMIYAAGYTQAPVEDVLLLKLTPAGELVWGRTFDGGGSDFAMGVAVDENGDVYVSGVQTFVANRHLLLQKWDSSGALVWSKHWGTGNFSISGEVLVSGGTVYTAGSLQDGGGDYDILLAAFDTAGSVQWMRSRDSGGNDYYADLAGKYTLTGLSGISILSDSVSGGKFNCWKLEYGADGTFQSAAELGTTNQPKRYNRMVRTHNILGGEVHYYITGSIEIAGETQLYVSKTDGSGDHVWGARLPDIDLQPQGACLDQSGRLLVAGFWIPDIFNTGTLVALDALTGASEGRYSYWRDDAPARAYSVQTYAGGLLVGGYGLNSSQQDSFGPAGVTAMNFDFNALNGTNVVPSVVPIDSSQTGVGDVTSELVANSGAGGADGLVLLRESI